MTEITVRAADSSLAMEEIQKKLEILKNCLIALIDQIEVKIKKAKKIPTHVKVLKMCRN